MADNRATTLSQQRGPGSAGPSESEPADSSAEDSLARLMRNNLELSPSPSRQGSFLAEESSDCSLCCEPLPVQRSLPVVRAKAVYRGGESDDDEEFDELDENSEPLYRSAALSSDRSVSALSDDDNMPVYRSAMADDDTSRPYLPNYAKYDGSGSPPRYRDASSLFKDSFFVDRGKKGVSWMPPVSITGEDMAVNLSAPSSLSASPSRSCFVADLPSDVFDAIMMHLPAFPYLFTAMAVCRTWRDLARANYLQRVIDVPARPDALVRAVALARAGDTLRLQPGIHLLSSELTVDRPLRLLSASEADAVARWGAPPSLADALVPDDTLVSSSAVGNAMGSVGGAVVLVATLHVLLRTRCTTFVAGLTLCRMGDEVGYPNAVTYAETGMLRMERCRVTCGGTATSVPQALAVAFADAQEPGVGWQSRLPGGGGGSSGAAGSSSCAGLIGASTAQGSRRHSNSWSEGDTGGPSNGPVCGASSSSQGAAGADASARLLPPLSGAMPEPHVSGAPFHDERSHCPQSGVWVGAAASVELTGCIIAACMGPGVKIYRGKLKAKRNTIAFSSRGANVVANGGQVLLQDNEIKGANGDGISSWHNSEMRIERNSIHANSGAGIAVNTGGGCVSIFNNAVFDNACQNVLFATSQKEATMHDNDFEGNSARALATGHHAARPARP